MAGGLEANGLGETTLGTGQSQDQNILQLHVLIKAIIRLISKLHNTQQIEHAATHASHLIYTYKNP